MSNRKILLLKDQIYVLWNQLPQKAQFEQRSKIVECVLSNFWTHHPRSLSALAEHLEWISVIFGWPYKAQCGVISQDFGCSPVYHLAPPPGHPPPSPGLIVRTESRPVLSSTISGHQLANVGFKHWKRRTTRLCFSERTTKKSSTKTFFTSCQRQSIGQIN